MHWILAALSILLGALPGGGEPPTPPRIVVSIAPLAGIVREISGPDCVIETLIPPGVSEHGYDIPATRIAALASADLVVYVGLGLEPQIEKYLKAHPRMGHHDICFADSVDYRDPREPDKDLGGNDKQEKDHHEAESSEQDPSHDHDHHHAVDPHLWLDPQLVKSFVAPLTLAIVQVAPESQRGAVQARSGEFEKRIDELDAAFRAAIAAAPRKTIAVGHDAYARLAERYGFKTIPIADLHAAEPTPSSIAAVSAAAREHGLTTIFIEPQLSPRVATRIAQACKLKVRPLDPLGDGDWLKLMRNNLDEIKAALDVPSAPSTK